MGFIERELNRIAVALREPRTEDEYTKLYAAQLALSWSLEPQMFKAPYDFAIGTAEGSTDYPSECDRDKS